MVHLRQRLEQRDVVLYEGLGPDARNQAREDLPGESVSGDDGPEMHTIDEASHRVGDVAEDVAGNHSADEEQRRRGLRHPGEGYCRLPVELRHHPGTDLRCLRLIGRSGRWLVPVFLRQISLRSARRELRGVIPGWLPLAGMIT
jgi:hypothetical protein